MFLELLQYIEDGNVEGVQQILSNENVKDIINREIPDKNSSLNPNTTLLIQAILSQDAFLSLPKDNNRQYQIVELLLKAGAKHKVNRCYSSVDYAISMKNSRILKLLLENDANPRGEKKEGEEEGGKMTPFQRACFFNDVELARILLDYGPPIDDFVFQPKEDITALMHACCRGSVLMVKFLLENGEDLHLNNSEGKTARDMISSSEWGEKKPDLIQEIHSLLDTYSLGPVLK